MAWVRTALVQTSSRRHLTLSGTARFIKPYRNPGYKCARSRKVFMKWAIGAPFFKMRVHSFDLKNCLVMRSLDGKVKFVFFSQKYKKVTMLWDQEIHMFFFVWIIIFFFIIVHFLSRLIYNTLWYIFADSCDMSIAEEVFSIDNNLLT